MVVGSVAGFIRHFDETMGPKQTGVLKGSESSLARATGGTANPGSDP
jgi:hypothetical protein